jgi:hypothetical protein
MLVIVDILGCLDIISDHSVHCIHLFEVVSQLRIHNRQQRRILGHLLCSFGHLIDVDKALVVLSSSLWAVAGPRIQLLVLQTLRSKDAVLQLVVSGVHRPETLSELFVVHQDQVSCFLFCHLLLHEARESFLVFGFRLTLISRVENGWVGRDLAVQENVDVWGLR